MKQACIGACICGWRCEEIVHTVRGLTYNLDGTGHSCKDHYCAEARRGFRPAPTKQIELDKLEAEGKL